MPDQIVEHEGRLVRVVGQLEHRFSDYPLAPNRWGRPFVVESVSSRPARVLEAGEVLEETDLYYSTSGVVETCPCPGTTLVTGAAWYRPINLLHLPGPYAINYVHTTIHLESSSFKAPQTTKLALLMEDP